jgi:hypothetical protein
MDIEVLANNCSAFFKRISVRICLGELPVMILNICCNLLLEYPNSHAKFSTETEVDKFSYM